jgi:hypothetical protein
MDIKIKPKIFKPNNIIIDNIIFKKPYCIGNDIYNYSIKYILKELVVQTPILYIPFGINSYNNKKYLDVSLLNSNTDPEIKNLKKFIKNINNLVKKKINEETSKKRNKKLGFIDSLKKTNNSFYPERVRCTIDDRILVYNDQKMKVSFDCIQSKLYSKFLITPKCIWKSKTNFGINWDILQVKIYDKLILYEYSFLDEETSKSNETNEYDRINNIQNEQHQFKNDEKYKKYFRMLKMGVPLDCVKHKMIQDKLDPSVLDTNDKLDSIQSKPSISVSNNNVVKNPLRSSLLDGIKNAKLNPKTRSIRKTKNNNNDNNKNKTSDLIITQAMILGVKLNKTTKIEKSNKHFNPLISLDDILQKKSMLKSFE